MSPIGSFAVGLTSSASNTLLLFHALHHPYLHAPSPFLQCHVCPFLTGYGRPALLRETPFIFPFEAVHCMRLRLDLFKALTACCFANMEANDLSFPTSLRFLLPPSGSFPTLRFISFHVAIYVHLISQLPPDLTLLLLHNIRACKYAVKGLPQQYL